MLFVEHKRVIAQSKFTVHSLQFTVQTVGFFLSGLSWKIGAGCTIAAAKIRFYLYFFAISEVDSHLFPRLPQIVWDIHSFVTEKNRGCLACLRRNAEIVSNEKVLVRKGKRVGKECQSRVRLLRQSKRRNR